MRKIFLYISVAAVMFSCIKDAKHSQQNYPFFITQPVINIDDTGVTFIGSIERQGKEPIVDHGFVWGIAQNPTLGNSHISLGVLDAENEFQTRVTYDLKTNEAYYVRAYMATNDYVIYGNQQLFTSLWSSAPVIESIDPQPVKVGSIVSIKGRRLNNIRDILSLEAFAYVEIIEKNDTEVKIKIPVIKEGWSTLEIRDTENRTSLLPIDIISPWKSLDLPFELSNRNTPFCNYQDKLYTLYNGIIYQLDIQNKIYQPITMLSELTSDWAILYSNKYVKYFMIEDNFYICIPNGASYGLELFHCYNVTTNTWEILPSYLPITNSFSTTPISCFSIGDKLYLVVTVYRSNQSETVLVEYDTSTKIWKQISDVGHIFNNWFLCTATIYNGKAYINSNDRIWEFDNQTYLFQEKSHYTTGIYSHVYNDKIYITGNNFRPQFSDIIAGSCFFEYDPKTDQVKQLPQLNYADIASMFFWENFLYAYVYSGETKKYEYVVFDLSEL